MPDVKKVTCSFRAQLLPHPLGNLKNETTFLKISKSGAPMAQWVQICLIKQRKYRTKINKLVRLFWAFAPYSVSKSTAHCKINVGEHIMNTLIHMSFLFVFTWRFLSVIRAETCKCCSLRNAMVRFKPSSSHQLLLGTSELCKKH